MFEALTNILESITTFSEPEINDTENNIKRKKACVGCQTNLELHTLTQITEEDLTSTDEPSESYWKTLAEQRRLALDVSLKENEELHGRVHCLEEELNVSRAMLEETQNLVEVLTEMVQEQEETAEDKEGESSRHSLYSGSIAEPPAAKPDDDNVTVGEPVAK